jgi:hypothetical protein
MPMGPNRLGFGPLGGRPSPPPRGYAPDAFVAVGCNIPQKQLEYFRTREGPVRLLPCSELMLPTRKLGSPDVDASNGTGEETKAYEDAAALRACKHSKKSVLHD